MRGTPVWWLLVRFVLVPAIASELQLGQIFRQRCPAVTGSTQEQRQAFHHEITQWVRPSSPEATTVIVSSQLIQSGDPFLKYTRPSEAEQHRIRFEELRDASAQVCRSLGHECSWRTPRRVSDIFQCAYGPDW